MRAGPRDTTIDRQSTEKGDEDEDRRRDWREYSRRNERNAGLVSECREVVHPGETHDLPPRVVVTQMLALVGSLGISSVPPQEPVSHGYRRSG